MYLEIPHKYKYSKRFKVDDWFALKSHNPNNEKSVMCWVVIRYDANCKLKEDLLKNVEEDTVDSHSTPKKEFKHKMKEIAKDFNKHGKEGFKELEEVERRIRERRRKGIQDASVEKSTGKKAKTNPSMILTQTLSGKKRLDLGV